MQHYNKNVAAICCKFKRINKDRRRVDLVPLGFHQNEFMMKSLFNLTKKLLEYKVCEKRDKINLF